MTHPGTCALNSSIVIHLIGWRSLKFFHRIYHTDHLNREETMLKAAAKYDEYSPLHRLIWKMFENKAGKGDDAVLREMRKLFLRPELRGARAEIIRKTLLFDLIPKMLSSPRSIPIELFHKRSSPFLILLGKLGPNVCSDSHEGVTSTPLHWIADKGYNVRSMQIQVILAQQLIDAGAFVNKKSLQGQFTPLHKASTSWGIVNLDLIKLLLDHGGVRCRDPYYASQYDCQSYSHSSAF